MPYFWHIHRIWAPVASEWKASWDFADTTSISVSKRYAAILFNFLNNSSAASYSASYIITTCCVETTNMHLIRSTESKLWRYEWENVLQAFNLQWDVQRHILFGVDGGWWCSRHCVLLYEEEKILTNSCCDLQSTITRCVHQISNSVPIRLAVLDSADDASAMALSSFASQTVKGLPFCALRMI